MSNVNKTLNKVKRALTAKGIMPLINVEQFYGDNGPCTKYIIHYGNANKKSKHNDIVAEVFGKVNLLKELIKILKAGDEDE